MPFPQTDSNVVSHRLALCLCCACCLLLVGCLSPMGGMDGQPSDPPAGDVAADSFAALESVNATIVWEYDRPNETTVVRQHVLGRPHSNHIRVAVSAPPARAGNRYVSNGSTIWRYNATTGVVRIQQYEGASGSTLVDRKLRYIFDRLNESSTPEAPPGSVGISPLPVVPSGSQEEGVSMANLSIEYRGTATVAGRTAHEVHLETNATATGLVNQTVWFDTETFYQLGAETVVRTERGLTRVTQRVTNVTFNEAIPEQRFRFDPPADATVRRAGRVSLSTYGTRAALVANASLSVPEPEVPASFTFTEGRYQVTIEDGTAVHAIIQIYTRGLNSLTIRKANETASVPALRANRSTEQVNIGDRSAYYLRADRAVVWTCEGASYEVRGVFRKSTLIGVAESVSCE